AVQAGQDLVLDGRTGRPQLGPVGDLADHRGPLGPDGPGGLGQVAPQLGVTEGDPGGLGERPTAAQVANPGRGGRHAEKYLVHWGTPLGFPKPLRWVTLAAPPAARSGSRPGSR